MTNQPLIRITMVVTVAVAAMLVILYFSDPVGLLAFIDSIATSIRRFFFPQHFNY